MSATITPIIPARKLETRETLLGLKLLINTAQQRPLTREEAARASKAIEKELRKE